MDKVLRELYLKKSKVNLGERTIESANIIAKTTRRVRARVRDMRLAGIVFGLLTADRPIGVVDKYGKYIYEGDLVKVFDNDLAERRGGGGFLGEYIVKYDLESASYLLHNVEDENDVWQFGIKNREYEIIEKIGE